MALRRPAPPAARDEPERRAEPVAPKVLRDYALVADGVRGALVGSEGEVAWLCFPTWSDPAVIAGLLGAGGVYQVRPRGRAVAEGRYDDGTLVWTSRWVTEDGVLDVRNVLALPGDPRRAVLLRRVTAEGPPCVVDVALELASDYGRSAGGSWARTDEGSFVLDGPGWSARLSGLPEAVAQRSPAGGTQLAATLEVRPGEPRDLVVELACGQLSAFPPVDVATTWGTTERAWAGAVPACEDTIAPRDARRACAVLRAMTTSEGATIAAATTSLPEQDRADRNYDYRYAWVRDTCYVGQAGAAIVGGEAIMDDAVRWVSARLLDDGPATMPAYLPDGRAVPGVEDLGLPGYPGGKDVTGNRVRTQFQLDLFGDALCLLARAAGHDRLEADGWRAVEVAIDAIASRCAEPDAGIWELEPAWWAHSRLACVAGLRAVSGQSPETLADRALALADAILAEVGRTCVHPSGRWQRARDDDRVDASLLLGEVRGATRSDDPRAVATRAAVVEELSDDQYVYRYLPRGTSLGEGEGAFLICNFWMTLACLGDARTIEAARWFERARGSCGSPGLFSEEYDVEHHQLRGNLPQAFVHALLIEAAAHPGWNRGR